MYSSLYLVGLHFGCASSILTSPEPICLIFFTPVLRPVCSCFFQQVQSYAAFSQVFMSMSNTLSLHAQVLVS